MPPSPLDDRIVVAIPRPNRPQELKLCLDGSYVECVSDGSLLSTAVVKIAHLSYMPSSTGSTRSLSCGCSSASCCTVTTYHKDGPVSVSSPDLSAHAVSLIAPGELARRMTRQPVTAAPVLIDCRPFTEYNKSHVRGAVHINCADKISRRRLQQGKITVLDLVSCRQGKDSFKGIFSKDIVVYDENTSDLSRLLPSQPLHVVLESLRREGKETSVLKGGIVGFRQSHESLCEHSLHLQEGVDTEGASALSAAPPTSLPSTPDIDNAELTPILPFLYLGNEQDAQNLELMKRLNIGYILNVTTHLPLFHYEQGAFHYKRLPATDSNKQNLRQYFEEAFEFIEEAHRAGQALLIHCQAGVSRSATIVIAYLMKHTWMTMTDAYKFVKSRRPIISPNLNFMGQLLEFEDDLNSGVTPRILTPKLCGVETLV